MFLCAGPFSLLGMRKPASRSTGLCQLEIETAGAKSSRMKRNEFSGNCIPSESMQQLDRFPGIRKLARRSFLGGFQAKYAP